MLPKRKYFQIDFNSRGANTRPFNNLQTCPIKRWDTRGSERTFIFRIAHNRAISHIAQRSPISALEGELDPADPRPNPEREVSRAQQEERLLQAIRRLPITYRQAITLSLEGMSYSEIAEILGVGESNVGVRLNRARNVLREMLEVRHERR